MSSEGGRMAPDDRGADADDTHTLTKSEYATIAKEMATDGDRTPRQREVESCFGQSLPAVLRELRENADSKSAMLRRINDTLEANGIERTLSRGTLYSWLDQVADPDADDAEADA